MKKPPRIPPHLLPALERAADRLNHDPVLIDLQRLAWLLGEIARRSADPQGRNQPEAARLADRITNKTLAPGEAEELFELAALGALPEGFLGTVQRLVDGWPGDPRHAFYLAAIVEYYLEKGSWPHAAEADRQAAALAPDEFWGMDADAFKTLRKTLGLDWLPRGRAGRPRKK